MIYTVTFADDSHETVHAPNRGAARARAQDARFATAVTPTGILHEKRGCCYGPGMERWVITGVDAGGRP